MAEDHPHNYWEMQGLRKRAWNVAEDGAVKFVVMGVLVLMAMLVALVLSVSGIAASGGTWGWAIVAAALLALLASAAFSRTAIAAFRRRRFRGSSGLLGPDVDRPDAR